MIASFITALHFLFDWVLQTREIATTKKISFTSLLQHLIWDVGSYITLITGLAFIFVPTIQPYQLAHFWLINMITHGLIDWFLPTGNNQRSLINWTAFDQVLHLSILFITFETFIGNLI